MNKKHPKKYPFNPAEPAGPAFVGREKILRELASGLRDGQSYELMGQKKIGKTDFLRKLLEYLKRDGLGRKTSPLPVPIHFESPRDIDNAKGYFELLLSSVIQDLTLLSGGLLPLNLQKEALAAVAGSGPESFSKALNILLTGHFSATRQSIRPVLLLDAIHRVKDREALSNILGTLNNVVDRKSVNVLLSGRKRLVDIVPKSVSDITMLCQFRTLEQLEEIETGELIDIARRAGWRAPENAAELAHQLTDGHPYRLQYYLRACLEQFSEISPKSLIEINRQSKETVDKILMDAPIDQPPPSGTLTSKNATLPVVTSAIADADGIAQIVPFLSKVETCRMSGYCVVGKYVRHDKAIIRHLQSEANRIMKACKSKTMDWENFFVWGHPGEGKTFFVREIAASLKVPYKEINLNDVKVVPTAKSLEKLLSDALKGDNPLLCALDELDKRPDAVKWLYPTIFTFLDHNKDRKRAGASNKVFALIGSKQPDFSAFQEEVRKRDAGKDLIRRVVHPPIEIPKLRLGDRMLTVLSMIWAARPTAKKKLVTVSSLSLAHLLAMNPTNGAIAGATTKALRNVADYETSFTPDHLDLTLKQWETFYKLCPSAKSDLFDAYVELQP
jgi:hypothetical protein